MVRPSLCLKIWSTMRFLYQKTKVEEEGGIVSITIEDLLNSKDLLNIKLIAGYAGIQNRIELTNITDSEELPEWLSGHELILSSGLIFEHRPERIAPMIHRFHRAGASGILVKVGRYIKAIPQDAIDAAEECGLPLLVAPAELHFSGINRLLNRYASQVPQSTQRYTAFSALLEKGAGTSAFLRLLSSYIGADVVYYDNLTTKLYRSRKDCEAPSYDDPAREAFLKKNQTYPVRADGTLYGSLTVLRQECAHEKNELDTLTIHYAVSMLGITWQKRLPSRFQDTYWLERFIAGLLRGDPPLSDDEIRRRGRLCGYSFFEGTTVVVIAPNDHREGSAQRIEQLLIQKFQRPEKTLLSLCESEVILLYGQEDRGAPLEVLCKEIAGLCRRQNMAVTIGVSRARSSPRLLQESYQEALQSIAVGESFTGSGIYFCETQGCSKFLYTYAETSEAGSAVEEVLGNLLRYDAKKPSYTLLPTLKAIVRCGFNLTQAAEELYIHYNTLKYRYMKICEITGLDLSQFENQAKIFLALSLLRNRTKEENL